MRDKPSLSVVPADVIPSRKRGAKPAPASISEALGGDSRELLVAMRAALAKKLDDGQIAGNSIASAYRELRELDHLIRVADAESEAEERKRVGNDGARRSFDASAI